MGESPIKPRKDNSYGFQSGSPLEADFVGIRLKFTFETDVNWSKDYFETLGAP